MADNDDKTESDIEKALRRVTEKKQAEKLFNGSEYKAARLAYEKLLELQEDSEAKLETLLAIASCDEKLNEMQQDIDQKISDTVEHCKMSIHDVSTMAEQRKNSASVILIKLFWFQPEQAFQSIRDCIFESSLLLKKLDRAVAMKCIPLMRDMIEQSHQIENVDAETKALHEVECLYMLAFPLLYYNKYQDAITCCTEGIELMTGHYGSAASKYDIYATLLYKRGKANYELNNYIEAVMDFKLSITARKEAEDCDADEKKRLIGDSRYYLTMSYIHLKETNPEEANRLSEELQLREEINRLSEEIQLYNDLNPDSSEGEEEPIDNKTKDTAADNYTDVGKGIHVDYNQCLRQDHQVFCGKLRGVHDEDVAVKRIYFTEKHKEEVRIMVDLRQHPNTINYRASSSQHRLIYIAMELCSKDTLHEIVTEQTMSNQFKRVVLLQIAHGLKHIHEQEPPIVHGDLKPTNILCSRDGRSLKIADFGLSKKLEDGRTQLTRTSAAGTPEWMAPDEKLSAKADIFSYGFISYFVLTGGKTLSNQSLENEQEWNLEEIMIADMAKHLITWMLNPDRQSRPSANDVLKHPFFWKTDKKLQFYAKVSGYLKTFPYRSELKQELDTRSEEIVGQNWTLELELNDSDCERISDKQRKMGTRIKVRSDTICTQAYDYYVHSAVDLFRFISNQYRHFAERKEQEKLIYGDDVDGFWNFYASRFPKLFMHFYSCVKKHIEGEVDGPSPSKKMKLRVTTGIENLYNEEQPNESLPLTKFN